MGWLDFLLPRRDRIETYPDEMPAAVLTPRRPRAPAAPRPRGFRVSATENAGAGERAHMRLRDAFTPSQPVRDPTMLAGREELLTNMIRAIEDQRLHLVLFGDRGMGKTSLLHVLSNLASEARYIVHYSSCDEGSDFSDIFRAAADQVPLLYHRDHKPTGAATEGGATLASLLPEQKLAPRHVTDVFARLTGTRVLIILDEFDRSAPGLFRRQVAELIKNLSDRSTRVQLVVAGVAANLTELIEHIPSIRRNIVGLAVPNMTREEVADLIRKGERASEFGFEERAVDMIVYLAAGSPYIASLLGQHAGLLAADRGGQSVATEDVTAAIGRAADEIADRISERSRYDVDRAHEAGLVETLPPLAHAALRSGGRFGPEALSDQVSDPAVRAATLQRIERDYGLIEQIKDDPGRRYRFREEGVPIYLWIRFARDDISRAQKGASARV